MQMDKDLEAPCVTCTGYSNWIPFTLHKNPQHGPATLKEVIDDWFNTPYGLTQEDYDSVIKPRHYMLFEDKGIEVRDVIERLVWKVKMDTGRNVPDWEMAPMFDSDYTQMMQYLMRFMDKNGVEDLKKAKWYLDKLIQAYDDESDV
jgi:hypothetical protein